MRVAAFAQHRRAGEAVVGDPFPTQPRSVAGTEALDADEPRDLGREPNRRDLSAVTPELVDPERREDLLDAFAQRFHEIAERVRIAARDRVLEKQIRVHRIGAERERGHHVVKVPQASG